MVLWAERDLWNWIKDPLNPDIGLGVRYKDGWMNKRKRGGAQ